MNHLSESSPWFKTKVDFNNIKGDFLIRKSFTCQEIIWNVDIFFNFERDVNICLTCPFSKSMNVSFRIKLLNHKNEDESIKYQTITCKFGSYSDRKDAECWLGKTEQIIEPSLGFLLNDTLSIEVSIKIIQKLRNKLRKHCLSETIEDLLFDESTADCYIYNESSSERIPVHKFILQVRSPVFKAMLSSAMKESTSNEIIISDFDHEVVKEFIRFLYLDTCDTNVCDAKSLLAMAHKYEIKGLFYSTKDYLINSINIDNVVELLQLADVYEAFDLKEKALDKVKSNFKVLVESGRFYESLNSDLMYKVMCKLADAYPIMIVPTDN